MESEGRSPLRILRHALIISEVFTDASFCLSKNLLLCPAKHVQEIANEPPVRNRFSGNVCRRLGLSFHRESIAIVPLRVEIRACVELRVPGEMDLPQIPLWQSDHKGDSARKPT